MPRRVGSSKRDIYTPIRIFETVARWQRRNCMREQVHGCLAGGPETRRNMGGGQMSKSCGNAIDHALAPPICLSWPAEQGYVLRTMIS